MIDETVKILCDKVFTSSNMTQQQIVNKLINQGQGIVPDLMLYYEDLQKDINRKALLSVLIKLKDNRSENFFKKLLNSDNETIRSLATQGLILLDSQYAMQACITTINDSADFAHSDITPSVLSLAKMGDVALPTTLHLLNDEDKDTRQHVQKVFELVTYDKMQNQYKPRVLSDIARQAWNKLWDENGAYHWHMPEKERLVSIKKWKQWIVKNIRNSHLVKQESIRRNQS